MTTHTECRRCSGCVGMSHHWMADPLSLDDPEWMPGDYACKHCEQRGEGCEDCAGDGYQMGDESQPCKTCGEEGVIPIATTPIDITVYRIIESWEDWAAEALQAAQQAQNRRAAIEVMHARLTEVLTRGEVPNA